IENLESSETTTCPTCYQKVNPSILQEAKKSFIINKKEQEEIFNEATSDLENLTSTQNSLFKKKEELTNDLETVEQARKEIEKFQQEIKENRKTLSSLPETEDIESYAVKIDNIAEQITNNEFEKRKREEIVADSQESVFNTEELEFQEKFLDLVEKKIREYKTEVLKQKLDEVKDIIKEKWSQLMGREIWSIDFDKNFIPIIKYKGPEQTIEQSLRGLSGSEKVMMSIILRSALMEKLMKTKTLVLDDPAIFFDPTNLERAAEFYRELIEQKHLDQIILTTFDEDFKNKLQPTTVIELE
ncbi:MAG: hypothetical protein ACTSSF_06290, partial [Candidatus Heimdallarchaeaceae archaeon]